MGSNGTSDESASVVGVGASDGLGTSVRASGPANFANNSYS